jgi:hypothetical protein
MSTVATLTPCWRLSFRTEGTRSPGLSVPRSTREAMCDATFS